METTHRSQYFYGNKISEYGLKCGYLDYHTLAKSFDAVMVNDITKLFYGTINGEYCEAEQVNGIIDNSELIEAKRDQIETLGYTRDHSNGAPVEYIKAQIAILEDQISELEREQEEQPEIFQYFVISDSGARILQEYTNDPVYYLPALDCYVWGVTHWGTSWDYVLTDCKIVLED